MNYAVVILPLALNDCLTYSIPEELENGVKPGVRVVVSVGKKKLYTAIVLSITGTKPQYETKDIIEVIDSKPIITSTQLSLWQWISNYYLCTLGEVMKAALPSGLKLESETMVMAVPYWEASAPLKKNEQLVLDNLSACHAISIEELNKVVSIKNVLPVVQKLIDMGAATTGEELKEGFQPKTEAYVNIAPEYMNNEAINKLLDSLTNAPKQLEMLMQYIGLSRIFINGEQREVSKKELIDKSKSTASVLNSLISKNILQVYDKEVGRLNFGFNSITTDRHPLSEAQQTAYNQIIDSFKDKNVTLLHGVTSCGKTEIYIQLIEEVIKTGRQVLFLLPEIALTTQITTRLQRVFGKQLGVYHSKFSDNERVEVWNAMLDKNKEFKIILGVRSSIFLPFRDLGLIIVDEEHENTYKQYDPAPRYQARNCAIVLATMTNAKVLLGSATPSIETYYNATTAGKYGLVELNKRFGNIEMPDIQVVNMREQWAHKTAVGSFSKPLIDDMQNAFRRGEQVILFQNRRGFAPHIECKSCTYVPHCIYCDVSLTYHKITNELTCHYCGYTVPVPMFCPACQNPTLMNVGIGTEKIEEEVKEIFPDKKVARLDLDVARSRKNYEKIIQDFEQGKIDILVGTQMISKGLDFARVRIVGILRADGMLHYPDFRAHERAFQLMAQVSGRAGRKGPRGRVILQTSNPEHAVISQVKTNAYRSMYMSQITERGQFAYPPFSRLINLNIKGKDEKKTEEASFALAQQLRIIFGQRVYGPDVPIVTRIQSLHIRKIMLKLELTINLSQAKNKIMETINTLLLQHKSVTVSIDVDPA